MRGARPIHDRTRAGAAVLLASASVLAGWTGAVGRQAGPGTVFRSPTRQRLNVNGRRLDGIACACRGLCPGAARN